MISRRLASLILIIPVVALFQGCSLNRTTNPRSPTDVFFDTAEVLIDVFADDSCRDQLELKKRRKWQCDNLSAEELNELGITKQK